MARRSLVAVLVVAAMTVPVVPSGAQAQVAARDVTRFACPVDQIDAPFTDIDGNTHEVAIGCLFSWGVTQGTSETQYSPSVFVRRGQMAAFLYRLLQTQGFEADDSDQGFTDVRGHPHEVAINAIAALGVARGRTASRFAPQELVTRAEMATFLFRTTEVFGSPLPEGADAFTDDDGSTHEPAINAVAAAGIAQGPGGGRFDPSGAVTRAAMAAFLTRLLDWGIELGVIGSIFTEDIGAAALIPGEVSGGAGATGVTGSFVLVSLGTGAVCYELQIDHGEVRVASVHLHKGAPGTTGGTEVLTVAGPFAPHPFLPVSDSYATACVVLGPGVADDLIADTEGYYVEIHTEGAANAAARGQLGRLRSLLVAGLEGGNVVPPPGDPDGFGAATVATTSQPDDLCYSVVAIDIGDPTGAAIHRAPQGANGDVVVAMKPPAAVPEIELFISFECVGGLDPALVTAIAAAPQDFAVAITTAEHPGGALRGQLELLTTAASAAQVRGSL